MRGELSTPADLSALKRRVENLLTDRKLPSKWLYEQVGMTKTGWRQMWENSSMKVHVLQRMASVLGLTVGELMGEVAGMAAEPAASYQARPKYLEERVAELEEQVKQLQHVLRRKG